MMVRCLGGSFEKLGLRGFANVPPKV